MKKNIILFIISFTLASNLSFAAGMGKIADSVQNCTPGTYHLPVLVGLVMMGNASQITYTISGMDSNYCQITIAGAYVKPGQTQSTDFILNCALSSNDLAVLSQSLRNISSGAIAVSATANGRAASILKSACKKSS